MKEETKKINIDQLGNYLKKGHPEIDFALIFGSSKDGEIKHGSDMDIGIWFNKKYTEENILGVIKSVENMFPYIQCDLTILNSVSVLLRFEALKGKVLFIQPGKEENYRNFYSYTCREYEDRSFWIQQQLKYRGY